MADNDKQSQVYGRRLGRPLSAERQNALDTLLPKLEISNDLLNANGLLTTDQIFNQTFTQHWLEIGFGNGEHLAELMRRHPDYGFIGAEPFINGMSAFLKDIESDKHDNVRVFMDDAMLVVNALADNILDGIYILNPDPWHKKRHHKRRIVQKKNLDAFARVLKPGGTLIMSTDVPNLSDWMITESFNHPDFEWKASKADDWRIPPNDWIPTRYETKRAKGATQMVYLIFERKNLPNNG